MEMTVVIAVIALLVGFGLPAVRALLNSFQSQGAAKSMISAALASSRAIAAREQHYAGIRFQKAYHPEGPLKAPQYMIFIVHDQPNTKLANGFRAVEGLEPIKLPETIGVIDLNLGSTDQIINGDARINEDWEITDAIAFSVIFSPAGKLVIHPALVINREGKKYSDNSKDDIFNSESKAREKISMFVQDEYFSIQGLEQEQSRNSFIIYERDKFRQAYEKGRAYSQYLEGLEDSRIYINPYTGTMIN